MESYVSDRGFFMEASDNVLDHELWEICVPNN
jgi:hypothetical protein